jgi:hypothetical protein
LPFVPSSAVIERLATEGEARRAPLVALVAARLPADVDAVLTRLAVVPSPVARMLTKVIGAKAPARIPDAAISLLDDSLAIAAKNGKKGLTFGAVSLTYWLSEVH